MRVLAKRHGINQKTVAKWKTRTAVKDLPTGPKDAHSTTLSHEDEAIIIIAFRRHTLLPLADYLYVGIDRTSKLAFVRLAKTTTVTIIAFLYELVAAVHSKNFYTAKCVYTAYTVDRQA